MKFFRPHPGFLAAEIILAASTIAVIALSVGGLLATGQDSTQSAGKRTKAILLAEQGIEAVRNIRDDGFVNLSAGTYGLDIVGSQWTLSGSSDTTTTDPNNVTYTRTVVITEIDDDTRNIAIIVTWPQNQFRGGTVKLTTRLTDWQREIIPEDVPVGP